MEIDTPRQKKKTKKKKKKNMLPKTKFWKFADGCSTDCKITFIRYDVGMF